MVQDEVDWVLETVRENWPGLGDSGLYGEGEYGGGLYYSTDGYPTDLYRINRDEPEILETGERTKSLERTNGNAIAAALASRSTSPIGTGYNHEVETVVSVRIEGLTSRDGNWGHVDDTQHFNQLVAYAKRALLLERTYPTIEADDDIGRVSYLDLRVENEQPLSSQHKDLYRTDFDVRLTGRECLPDT